MADLARHACLRIRAPARDPRPNLELKTRLFHFRDLGWQIRFLTREDLRDVWVSARFAQRIVVFLNEVFFATYKAGSVFLLMPVSAARTPTTVS